MTHKSVRLLPKAVDLAAVQDTLPQESHASAPSSSGEARCMSSHPGQLLSSPPQAPLYRPDSALRSTPVMPLACLLLLGPNAYITLQVTIWQ